MLRLLPYLLVSNAAWAGISLDWERVRTGEEVTHLAMKCESGSARFEADRGKQRVLIWNDSKRLLSVLVPGEKIYSQTSEEELNAIRQRGKAMVEQMRAQMDSLPPAQRAQAEAAFGAYDDNPEARRWKFTALDKKATVGQWECDLYLGQRGAAKVELCVVPWERSPVKRDELKCLQNISRVFGSMANNLARDPDATQDDLTQFPGLPVQTKRVATDGGEFNVTLRAAGQAKVPAEAFAVPKGFKKVKSSDMGQP